MKTRNICIRPLVIALWMTFLFSAGAQAATVAVLDFELKDLTLLPGAQEEVERTASIGPLLREALAEKNGLQLVTIDAAAQSHANTAFGYLFDHPEVAAELGEKHGADYVAVGRVHKPSFLFVYLKVRLVDVNAKRLVGDYVVEIKGYLDKLNRRGVASLAKQIVHTINPQ